MAHNLHNAEKVKELQAVWLPLINNLHVDGINGTTPYKSNGSAAATMPGVSPSRAVPLPVFFSLFRKKCWTENCKWVV